MWDCAAGKNCEAYSAAHIGLEIQTNKNMDNSLSTR